VSLLEAPITLYRVEDARNEAGFNGFHVREGSQIADEIVPDTLADVFYDPKAAVSFAKECQRRFPAAAVVVTLFAFITNESGHILSTNERMWP
jgi:hypothetical protein